MQIVCMQWSQKQTMISLGINEKHFVSSTRILGLDFVADSSNPCPTEQRRKAAALRILPRLQVLPMLRSFKEVLYRTRCQTIISWGCWMTGHNPDFDSAWITQLKKVLGAHRMASRALWTLLQGHWVSPLLTANIACVSHFIRSLNFWHSRQVFVHDGAWVSRVRDILQKAGFEQISFGHFRHPTWGDHQFCNQFWKQTSKNVAHQLREIWRKSLFVSFLAHSRRDSRALSDAGVVYNDRLVVCIFPLLQIRERSSLEPPIVMLCIRKFYLVRSFLFALGVNMQSLQTGTMCVGTAPLFATTALHAQEIH